MAYFSLHAYDADVSLQSFMGLSKTYTELNGDIRYADEEKNVETPNGVLQPMAASEAMDGEFEGRIETLAQFHRRWYRGQGRKDWLVACVNGHLYSRQVGSHVPWIEIELPTGIDAFQSSVWSYVTYEENVPGSDYTVDVLLMSNKKDGMIMVIPPDRPRTWQDIKERTWADVKGGTWRDVATAAWTIQTIQTAGYRFGVICRHAERIWGGDAALLDDDSGEYIDEPDVLVYSRPYDPKDWTGPGPDEEPEDCSGEVRQPSWDGDSFTTLTTFGDQLIAHKRHRVWRIVGTNPGEYVFKEQYGGGAAFPNTVAVDGERMLMAEEDGMSVYDGMSVTPYARANVERIWARINRNAMGQMCGTFFRNRYYLAFPMDDSEVNNALLIYNNEDKTILFYDNIYIESLMATEDTLYATSSSLPGRVVYVNYDSWLTGKASGRPTQWVTPWMDFGYKRIVKGGFEVYFTPEVQNEAVTLKFSVQTEKKTKTKEYTIQPLTEEQEAAGKEHRYKRLHFGGSGRRFRLMIETEAGSTAPWRLIGGIQMVVETDPD